MYFPLLIDALIDQQLQVYSTETNEKCIPLSFCSNNKLKTKVVYRIFKQSTTKYKNELSEVPPVLPKEG